MKKGFGFRGSGNSVCTQKVLLFSQCVHDNIVDHFLVMIPVVCWNSSSKPRALCPWSCWTESTGDLRVIKASGDPPPPPHSLHYKSQNHHRTFCQPITTPSSPECVSKELVIKTPARQWSTKEALHMWLLCHTHQWVTTTAWAETQGGTLAIWAKEWGQGREDRAVDTQTAPRGACSHLMGAHNDALNNREGVCREVTVCLLPCQRLLVDGNKDRRTRGIHHWLCLQVKKSEAKILWSPPAGQRHYRSQTPFHSMLVDGTLVKLKSQSNFFPIDGFWSGWCMFISTFFW